ncbi:MAG: NUDIX domain-containing protein [Candidatus Pacebacteria bacterium]|nr:NUDIX domain-containing protein [Candidatus Paceibacterota bacterium]
MPKFLPTKSKIHFIARGLLIQDKNIILCHIKGRDWYFLPGGHVKNSESAQNALLRELKEEIGKNEYIMSSFIGVCENIFSLDENTFQQEVNIIFQVNVSNDLVISSKENNLEFISIEKEKLSDYNILPEKMKNGIQNWMITGRPFLKEI